jgi:hypothetical protein
MAASVNANADETPRDHARFRSPDPEQSYATPGRIRPAAGEKT